MAYTLELGSDRRAYIDNAGDRTTVTLASGNAGQQQQSSSQFSTGAWTAPPKAFNTGQGIIIRLTTSTGTHHLQIQGNQMGVMSGSPAMGNAQQMQMSSGASMPDSSMQPMQPMEPMQPMKMGNMEMNANPMQMRMGNMEMHMGRSPGGDNASSSAGAKAKFCSQCGTPVAPDDRFCAQCGHRLNA